MNAISHKIKDISSNMVYEWTYILLNRQIMVYEWNYILLNRQITHGSGVYDLNC
jgi:hypothetical protein